MKPTDKPSDMGMNRTGASMSPKDSAEMAKIAQQAPVPPGDESLISQLRAGYGRSSEPVGTMPPPASMKGMARTAATMIKGKKATVLLDKLGERLAFERTGTRIYEAAIDKLAAMGGGDGIGLNTNALREIQLQEMEHMQLVAEALIQLGADPTTQTPCADVAGVQSMGLLQVLTDPRTTVSQCLGALLTAELVDNASWDMLVQLAKDYGQDDLAPGFERALAEEATHLTRVKAWLVEATRLEARGQSAVT